MLDSRDYFQVIESYIIITGFMRQEHDNTNRMFILPHKSAYDQKTHSELGD